jgi:WD repeat and FYVE domain-containing protein 3
MWSLEFVEVADEEKRQRKATNEKWDAPSSGGGAEQDNQHTSPSRTGKSSSMAIPGRLDDFKDPSLLKTKLTECSSSVDSDTGHMVYAVQNWLNAEKVDRSGTRRVERCECDEDQYSNTARDDGNSDEIFAMDDANVYKRTSAANVDVGTDAAAALGDSSTASSQPTFNAANVEASATTAGSVDDSPTSGDFCFVTVNDVKDAMSSAARSGPMTPGLIRRKLRDGFRWQKQLVFRSKLTMHTAFERKDNKDPASVTALAVSRFAVLVSSLRDY